MTILAFDTATRATAVALCGPVGRPLQARDHPPPGSRPNHASTLLPFIAELLERSGTGWDYIERIAVGVGPGTFTGLRIGLATAHALSRARGILLVGVSTLESLAAGAERQMAGCPPEQSFAAVLAVLDARRGEVFAAGWSLSGSVADGGTAQALMLRPPLLAPSALAPEKLTEITGGLGRSTLAVGDGAVKFRSILERSGAFIPEDDSELHRVNAVNHCFIARALPASAADEVRPEYLRLPDAEIAHRAVAKR